MKLPQVVSLCRLGREAFTAVLTQKRLLLQRKRDQSNGCGGGVRGGGEVVSTQGSTRNYLLLAEMLSFDCVT